VTLVRPRGLETTILIAVGVALIVRFALFGGGATEGALMTVSVLLFLGVQAVLAALRAPDLVRVVYGYLATPYFGNRALWEVWLGSPLEPGAGTFAPFLLGDALVVLILARLRPRVPLALLAVLVVLLLPLLVVLWAPFDPGAFVYQYLGIARVIVVGWLAARLLRSPDASVAGVTIAWHLGAIFATMSLVSISAALVTGGRFGFPGWGVNVYANALCVVAALCAWHALDRRRISFALFAGACLFGIVASGTRVALVVLLCALAAIVLTRALPRRVRVLGSATLLVLAASVLLVFPGPVLTLAGDLNPRVRTVGGVEMHRDIGLTGVVRAVSRESSVRTRVELLSASATMVERSPLLGVGWGQWNWQKAEHGVSFDVLLDPHNGYAWVLAESGLVVGGLLLLAVLVVLVRMRASPFAAAFVLILLLELTNANVQKSLYGVLTAVVVAVAWTATRGARRRPPGDGPPLTAPPAPAPRPPAA
jgi:hypothetical protein